MESNHDLSVEYSVPSKRFDESSDLQKISGNVVMNILIVPLFLEHWFYYMYLLLKIACICMCT